MNRIGLLSLLILLAMCIYAALSYGDLPEQIAVHFNLEGVPDRFEDKATFHQIFIPVSLFAVLFSTILLPWVVSKFPQSWTNIPNKDYWFATPERRAEVKKFQDTVISTSGLYLISVLFLAYVSIVDVNTDPLVDIPIMVFVAAIIAMTIVYIILMIVWLLRFSRRPT